MASDSKCKFVEVSKVYQWTQLLLRNAYVTVIVLVFK